jgi:hypothetical protein
MSPSGFVSSIVGNRRVGRAAPERWTLGRPEQAGELVPAESKDHRHCVVGDAEREGDVGLRPPGFVESDCHRVGVGQLRQRLVDVHDWPQ